jgi:HlyD family secretion protein
MDRKIKKKRFTPKRIAYVVVAVVALVLVVHSIFFANHDSRYNVRVERITISEVVEGLYLDYIPANGTVLPLKTVYLDAVEGGQVETVFIRDGSPIEQGDPIIQLSNTNLLLDIMYREAELFQQINNLRNTRITMQQNALNLRGQLLELDFQISEQKRQYDHAQTLMEKDLISSMEFNRTKDNYYYLENRRDLTLENHRTDSLFRAVQIESLEMSVTRMQNNLEIVKQRQDKLTLRAPITGMLTSLFAEVGETKSQGQRIGQIDKVDGFKVRAAIDEYYIARISKGLKGSFTFSNVDYEIEIDRVYLEVRDGRFEVDLLFTGTEPEGIRRGQTVRIRLELGGASEAILIPRGGFYQSTGGHWIYVVSEDGTYAIKRDIGINRMNPQNYEVTEGLEPGERVITSSYDTFGDVDRLILKQ